MTNPSRYDSLTDAQLQELHGACETFEQALETAAPIRIEECLLGVSHEICDLLFQELLAIELERQPPREWPTYLAAYRARFPDGHPNIDRVVQEITADCPPTGRAEEGGDAIVRPTAPDLLHRGSDSRYQLQGEIARGGMGAILKGRDANLGRDLAIKVLLDEHKDKPDVIRRFIEEAQINGQLQHPGIAPVYELGEFADKRPFISMKLVKGETLAKLLADRVDPVADRGKLLGIFQHVCQTMAYAHSRRVIHRDLKPANVMVGAFGEVQVMDWGLAKVLSSPGDNSEKQTRKTQPGQSVIHTLRTGVGSDVAGAATYSSPTLMGSVLGTPAYMPPEQALGEIDNLDERADVFGLGAILCEILTGKPPYIGDDSTQVVRLATRGKLDECFQRLADCGADADLIDLTKHCLAPEPKDRPRNASIVAERVSGYLQSVETRLRETEMDRAAQVARLEQQRQSARKLRKMIAVLGVAAAIAIGAFLVAGKFWQDATVAKRNAQQSEATAQTEATRANEQKRRAEENLIKAEMAEQEAIAQQTIADQEREVTQENLYYAQMHLAHQAWREHRGLPRMRELLAQWVPRDGLPDRRGWEWFYLNSLPYQNLRTFTESRNREAPCHVAWHAPSNRLAEGATDGVIRIWDVPQERTILTLHMSAPYPAFWGGTWFGWSPDGRRLAAGALDGAVHVWETASGRKLHVLRDHNAPLVSVAFNSDGARVAAWGNNGVIKIWDANSGALTADVVHPAYISAGAWSPDDKLLASGQSGGTVTISAPDAGAKVTTLQGHISQVHALAWSPDSARLATASYDLTARVWEVASEKTIVGPLRHGHEVASVAWQPNGNRLATGSFDETVRIWNAATGREEFALRGHPTSITALAWGSNGNLASGGGDGSMKIWTAIRDQEASELSGHVVRATSVSWSPDGQCLASAGDDGKIRIWDSITRQELSSLTGHDPQQTNPQFGLIRALAWSKDGAHLASASLDGVAKVWEIASGREIYTLSEKRGATWCIAWHPDGDRLAAGSQDGTIHVVDGITHTPTVMHFQAHTGDSQLDSKRAGVRALAWSPQGDRLASAGWDTFVKIWDPIRGVELARMQGHAGWVLSVAWSADGKRLASAGADDLVMTWDPDSGQRLLTMRGHHDFVDAVAWSPDGGRLASAGLDNAVRVWDPRTGEEAFVLRGKAGMFHDVAWRRDGAQLAAASSDGQIWIWDATRGFERDTTPRALPYIDRQVALGTARGDDLRWYAESYVRAGKHKEALAVVKANPHGLYKLARFFDEHGQALWAAEARTQARTLLERQWAGEADNEAPPSELADRYAAEQDWEGAIAEYSKFITDQTADNRLLAGRAAAYMATQQWELARADWRRIVAQQPDLLHTAFDQFQKAQRWSEAAEFGLLLIEQAPDNSMLWVYVAPTVVLSDDEAAYEKFCNRLAHLAGKTPTPEAADRVIKACLLRPGAIDLAELPGDALARSLDEGTAPEVYVPWFWVARALLAYRSGDAESAVKYVSQSEAHHPHVLTQTLSRAVLAMAHYELQHPDEARRALESGMQRIARLKEDANTNFDPDLLIAEIVLREAQTLIRGKAQ